MSADWNEPELSTAYSDVLDELKDRDLDSATLFVSAPTNPVDGMMRYVRASNKFQEYLTGSWTDKVLSLAGGGTGGATASDARTNLGLGTIAVQNANNVNITGGSISGVTFGGSSITISGDLSVGGLATITGTLGVTGAITGSSTLAATAGIFGTNPSTTGSVRIPNNSPVSARNNANNANLSLILIDTSDVVQIAPSSGVNFGSYVSLGTNSAGTGKIRLPNDQYIYSRDNANSADKHIIGLDTADNLRIGFSGSTAVFGGAVILQATASLYFDGGGDSRMYESSANVVELVAGGNQIFSTVGTDLRVHGALRVQTGGAAHVVGASSPNTNRIGNTNNNWMSTPNAWLHMKTSAGTEYAIPAYEFP